MNKVTNRQLQRERTLQHIIESANRCFIRKGMAYTLITDICEEANVSVGTFYHYFKNKNDLIISQFRKFDFGFLDEAEPLINETDGMKALIDFAFFFSRDAEKEHMRVLNIEYLKARVSLSVEQLYPKNRPYFLILCTIIANGQKRKQIRTDMYPWEIANLVMASTRGYNLDWASYDGSYNLKERMKRDMPILFNGLLYRDDKNAVFYENPLPEQNVPVLYKEEVIALRKYCIDHLI